MKRRVRATPPKPSREATPPVAAAREQSPAIGPTAIALGVVGLSALAVFVAVYLRLWGFIQDDVFISARYAHHLTEGAGLVYNRGERVEGYTNFLYTLLLAMPFALHWDLVAFVKIANAVLVALAAGATYRLGRVVVGATHPSEARFLALIPAVLLLLTPATIVSAAEGLETMLFTLLLVLAVERFLAESGDTRVPGSGVALAALAMTRPDGVAFVPWLLIAGAIAGRPKGHLLRVGLVFLLLYGAYFAARALYYGHLLPNTYYAKMGGSAELLARGWQELGWFARECGAWAWLVIPFAFVPARTRSVVVLLAGLVAARFAFQLWSGGALMDKYRFLVPVLPFLHLLVVIGVQAVVRQPALRAAALAAAIAIQLVPGWLAYPSHEANVLHYGAGLRRAHLELGRRVSAKTAPEAVLAMDDAGIGPLVAGRTTVDMLGLNDAHIAHLPGGYGKIDVGYVLGRRPDLVVLIGYVERPVRPEDFHLPGHRAIYSAPAFQTGWRYARTFTFGGDYHLVVYRRVDSRAVPADF